TALISWGDGTTSPGDVQGTSVLGSHTYADGGSFLVTVRVTDAAGHSGTAYATAAITDPPPVPPPLGPLTLPLANPAPLALRWLAATRDATAAGIEWGDGHHSGGTFAPVPDGGYDILGTPPYQHAGTYTAVVTLLDGALASARFRVALHVQPEPDPAPLRVQV